MAINSTMSFDSPPPEPIEVLKEKVLDERDLKQAEVAKATGISPQRLNMILKGRRPISAEVALRLEKVFGIPPGFWFKLRAEFDLFKERERIRRELETLPELRTSGERQRSAGSADRSRQAA